MFLGIPYAVCLVCMFGCMSLILTVQHRAFKFWHMQSLAKSKLSNFKMDVTKLFVTIVCRRKYKEYLERKWNKLLNWKILIKMCEMFTLLRPFINY